ncbi:hypothetical protein ACO2Q3_26580 [Caulobacter sp. KR2-114]|uniref:hypothetical protein n=1 Tax=Caulobacter sp. KR2-114 TaxID=3400912 RepID=UPI003C0C2A2E
MVDFGRSSQAELDEPHVALTVEEMYQEIGRLALSSAEDLCGKLIVHSEVEDGVISSDIFYENDVGAVRYKFSPNPLMDLIYEFWEIWQSTAGNCQWSAMTYVVESGNFSLELIYPDQITRADYHERRPLIITKHFGEAKVDYSRPQ